MLTHRFPARCLVTVLACGLLAGGCRNSDSTLGNTPQKSSPGKANESRPATQVASPVKVTTKAHDPTHPPIDCPLRKQGIDPSHMRPFEDVERYIAFLEREDRAAWQKPDEVVTTLELKGNETVVDLGSGSGYFAFRFAKALPRGKVVAADIEPEMIRHIHHRAMTEGIGNIEARLIDADAPSVPTYVDLVFICDVLHHVSNRPAWLATVTKAMPSGARLVLIEFKAGDLPEGPPESMKIPHEQLVELVTGAGLVLDSENAKLLPYQTFLVFRKP